MDEAREAMQSKDSKIDDSQPLVNAGQLISGLYSNERRAIKKCDILNAIEMLKVLRKCEAHENITRDIDLKVTDLMFATITAKPTYSDQQFMESICDYFSTFDLKINNVLLSRNIHVLVSQSNATQIWIKYEQILNELYSKNLLTAETIESEILSLLKDDWSEDILDKLATILQSLVNCSRRENKQETELMEVVDWLAWFCRKTNEF